jgi:hypothetical protein
MTIRGTSNLEGISLRTGVFRATGVACFRSGSLPAGIELNSCRTRARARSGSNPPQITRAALLG